MPCSSRPRSGATDHYADAFELRWSEPDDHTAEQWVRAGIEGAPRPVRAVITVAHRVVLGFRLGPRHSPDHVLGWPITCRTTDEIELRASSWLVEGVIATQRVDPTTARLTTVLEFRRRPARAIWRVVGPAHRAIAPLLLARAGATIGVRGAERPRASPVVPGAAKRCREQLSGS